MDRVIQEQIQQYAFKRFPILSGKPLKPLAIGAGAALQETLCQSFSQADVSFFWTVFLPAESTSWR